MRVILAAVAAAALLANAAPAEAQATPRPYPPPAAAVAPMAGPSSGDIADELNRQELHRIASAAFARRHAWRNPPAWRDPPAR